MIEPKLKEDTQAEVKRSMVAQVPEAWATIVLDMAGKMFARGWDGKYQQIKEKYGSLRFYIQSWDEQLENIIEEAEKKTTEVCIECGKPATGTTAGWVAYVCDEHKR